ncbi:GNAT family N-acetyltransferase [Pseudoalteromonas sp. Of7M-16]|uniref:GNAT family N-acetyltransferase n=1 Tax=Pseudoalteromonas sp. Of7M-16 TaxID=2917756 RepID=UPI001EF70DB9|nr:GNAT family N-acetyltransferase [Pseudoalteromonas sp. Of7M-16]MCG7546427.1 hypothetical protein [Pseudoalteromonas sp. Of7M-16]
MNTCKAMPLLPNDNQHKLLALEVLAQHICDKTLSHIDHTASEHGATKILLKVQESNSLPLLSNGYQIEATIPKFYNKEDAIYVAKFLENQRQIEPQGEVYDDVLDHVIASTESWGNEEQNISLARQAHSADARNIAKLFANNRAAYSNKQHDEAAVVANIRAKHIYFVIEYLNNIVAVVHIKLDKSTHSAFIQELVVANFVKNQRMATTLVDFALMQLRHTNTTKIHCHCLSGDYAMNKVMARHDFNFGGRLANQLVIKDQFQSVNIWSKHLNAAN